MRELRDQLLNRGSRSTAGTPEATSSPSGRALKSKVHPAIVSPSRIRSTTIATSSTTAPTTPSLPTTFANAHTPTNTKHVDDDRDASVGSAHTSGAEQGGTGNVMHLEEEEEDSLTFIRPVAPEVSITRRSRQQHQQQQTAAVLAEYEEIATENQQQEETHAALKIQARTRGNRDRAATKNKQQQQQQEQQQQQQQQKEEQELANAALKNQARTRGNRDRVATKNKQQQQELLAKAPEVVEQVQQADVKASSPTTLAAYQLASMSKIVSTPATNSDGGQQTEEKTSKNMIRTNSGVCENTWL